MIRAAVIAAALSAVLIVAYVAQGGGDYSVAKAPAPCERRAAPTGGNDLTGTIQRVGFAALDSAACDLKVSRERLLLALTGEAQLPRGITEQQRSEAFKAGLREAIDREEQAGRIPDTISGLLRNAIDFLPIEQLIQRFFESAGGGGFP